ncbi:hypothetical protein BJ973_002035 [Actinoplanes tereljensis]|uniref:Pentapeptide repeat protein n=1 Tax=Paractinoplanes tereljensis TaxID=571912 RepID=A0A919TSA9_9ACTN|nr:pentapeptide repeat-containing protein [Actinoplanes tereljensis]GIF20059.1 hypothetical protein Ate02nite_27890 [Actinoplanes tereljensis]
MSTGPRHHPTSSGLSGSDEPSETADAEGATRGPDIAALAALQRAAGAERRWFRPQTRGQAERADAASEQPPRLRDQLLWLWPGLGIAIIFLAGEWAGPLGSVLAALVGLVVLVNFVGDLELRRGARLWIAVAAIVLGVVTILGNQYGVTWLGDRPVADAATKPSSPADLRGKAFTQSDLPSSLKGAGLVGATLDGLDLSDRSLDAADARAASFRGATMIRTGFGGADLRGANLSGGRLRGADLRDADLRGASLTGADLTDSDLRGACLVGLDLTGVTLLRADADGAAVAGVILPSISRAQTSHWPATPGASAACR